MCLNRAATPPRGSPALELPRCMVALSTQRKIPAIGALRKYLELYQCGFDAKVHFELVANLLRESIMRVLTVSSLVVVFAWLLPLGPAAAEPCGHPGSHKGYCYCKPPLTKACGPVWNEYFKQNFTECWCHNPSADDNGFVGSYGHAEIHKKNVPQTHPTPTGNIYMRSAAGVRTMRRPAVGMMRRW